MTGARAEPFSLNPRVTGLSSLGWGLTMASQTLQA